MKITRPCLINVNLLGTPNEKGLAELLPENCFVQYIILECSRTARSDKKAPWVGSDFCSLKVSAPSVYMNRQSIPLTTPVERLPGSYDWPGLIKVLENIDMVAASYGGPPMRNRIHIKGCVIVELPIDKLKESKNKGGPNPSRAHFFPDDPDPLYEGVRFARIIIEGTQFLSDARDYRNGWLPDSTHTPMEIVEIQWSLTKHIGYDQGLKTEWTAYSRKAENMVIIDEKQLIGISNAELYSIIPSLSDSGIIQMREQETTDYNLKRGRIRDIKFWKIGPDD